MNLASTKIDNRLSFTGILYVIFFISLIGAFRAITSITTGLLLLTVLLLYKPNLKSIFSGQARNQFTAACILFFLLQLIALFYTHDLEQGWSNIRLKSGLLFLPLALLWTVDENRKNLQKLLGLYCILLLAASVYLLFMAGSAYLQQHRFSSFFYYDLVSPFGYHPVYFSILVFIALVYMLENPRARQKGLPSYFIFPVIFFSIFLVLLASKLILSFYVVYLFYFFATWYRRSKAPRFLILGLFFGVLTLTALVLTTRNPVSHRFLDLFNGKISLVKQERFSPAVYFNGIQLRLLEWKLVPEILEENHCWWTGVSAGDAQAVLNRKYLSINMYRGEPGKTGHGYLGYNTHSQFLEALLQNGIPGFICYLLICVSLLRIAFQKRNRLLSFTVLLLLVYSLIESIFQEQYGIVIFTFFPLFISQYPNPLKKSTDLKTNQIVPALS